MEWFMLLVAVKYLRLFVTDDAMVKTIIRRSEDLGQKVKGSNPGVSKAAKDFFSHHLS